MTEIRVDDPSEWAQKRLGYFPGGLKVCRICDKFGLESEMTKVEPPGEEPYYLCAGCESKLKHLFRRHGKRIFNLGC